MIKHPLNRAYRPSAAFSAQTPINNHAVTIARQADEIRELRRKLDTIAGLTNGVSFGRSFTATTLLVFYHAVKSVIQERQS